MDFSKRIDRKRFLTWGLASTTAWAVGCSDDPLAPPLGGGTSGSGGTVGTAGSASGSGGTFSTAGGSAGSGGSGVGGGAGTSAGSGGTPGGSSGAAGGGGTAPINPDCSTQLKVSVTKNHGHTMQVSLADVMAGVAKVYDTKGASEHPHWIQLTAADFTKLKAGGTVRKLSCNDGHEHEYIVNCVGIAMPDETAGSLANYCDAERSCADMMGGNFCPELP